MKVNSSFLLTNPFFEAYYHSDFLGKGIIMALFLLSIFTWIILIQKMWMTFQARKNSLLFNMAFQKQRLEPLAVNYTEISDKDPNPFKEIYLELKKHTIDILNKNHLFSSHQKTNNVSIDVSYLSAADIEFVDAQLYSTISLQIKQLEKNVFILSTIASLGPFLGLLGTVWGILTTFSELQTSGGGATNQMVIGGLSLALATTVLGLIDAIPALVGYNYLKNTIRDFQTEMERFSTEILASVEMQYRKVDIPS
jgi:biopolymer transport protein TolQ